MSAISTIGCAICEGASMKTGGVCDVAGLRIPLEDHEGELVPGSLGVLSKVAQLGDDVAAVVCGALPSGRPTV